MACQAYYIATCEVLIFPAILIGMYCASFGDEEVEASEIKLFPVSHSYTAANAS